MDRSEAISRHGSWAASLAIALFILSASGCRRNAAPEPTAAMAVRSVVIEKAHPVTQELLDFNPQRKAAGCAEVAANWLVAPISLIVEDGPQYVVLLDERKVPVKVVERYGELGGEGRRWRELNEYAVAERRLNGKAARWEGTPLALCATDTYRDNVLNGPTDYFAKDGQKIGSCEYRSGVPWTGRVLHRDGFDQPRLDISYASGRQNGSEVYYPASGSPVHLRTFKMGIQDGPELEWREGLLRFEFIYENGVIRQKRSWHDNGQLEASGEQDAKGKLSGQHRRWDREGRLVSEENYRRGKFHGWRWEEGHGNGLWWWDNKHISGKAAFEERAAKEAAR